VASQIDSRTIIDTQGAEKLIGRGDMLYAPVGASKPVRVQGAFVSETEIEEIVGSIRDQKYGVAYSDDVMSQINKAAEICGQKKGKSASAVNDGGADDNDPMLGSAIELAVECGKISTSLIQRRLQLGYGRAAKIIDMMERRGIVSAPEGQKPRAVLITREQYLEMQMNRSGESKPTENTMF
jgi:S-DNA-T family DNA segregation ATPase FtsK/SpoIIIE